MSFDVKFTWQGFQNACWVARLAKSDSTYVLEAEPGKFYIKGREPGILFSVYPLVNYTIMTKLSFFVDKASLATSFKKVQRHHDLLKTHAVR